MTKAFILCDLLWKVQKSHAANREGSFNVFSEGIYKQYTHLPVKHAYSMIDFHQPHNQDNILPCTIPDECHPP